MPLQQKVKGLLKHMPLFPPAMKGLMYQAMKQLNRVRRKLDTERLLLRCLSWPPDPGDGDDEGEWERWVVHQFLTSHCKSLFLSALIFLCFPLFRTAYWWKALLIFSSSCKKGTVFEVWVFEQRTFLLFSHDGAKVCCSCYIIPLLLLFLHPEFRMHQRDGCCCSWDRICFAFFPTGTSRNWRTRSWQRSRHVHLCIQWLTACDHRDWTRTSERNLCLDSISTAMTATVAWCTVRSGSKLFFITFLQSQLHVISLHFDSKALRLFSLSTEGFRLQFPDHYIMLAVFVFPSFPALCPTLWTDH